MTTVQPSPAAGAPELAPDADELRAVLDRDERAWQAFVKRYDPVLRGVVRDASEATRPLADAEIDDVLGDLWVRLLENDMRLLRAFNPTRGSTLFTWLTFQVAHVAHEHLRQIGREPETVSLAHAPHVPAPPPRRSPRLRAESAQAAAEQALLSDLADLLVAITLDGKLDEPVSDEDAAGA